MDLTHLGWRDHFAHHFAPFAAQQLLPARVVRRYGQIYDVHTEVDIYQAESTGKLRHEAKNAAALPAVGDWVAIRRLTGEAKAAIIAVLPRQSAFIRQSAGHSGEPQVVAANVDTVFLLMGLDTDWNPRRLERYLTLAFDSGARPVIILNKADVRADAESVQQTIEAAHPAVSVHRISALQHQGLDTLAPYLVSGTTVAFLGSSGVGKSTLVNALMGEDVVRTGAVRDSDSRGQHTTTRRDLLRLPCNAWVMDTPGMREVHLGDAKAGLAAAFDDIVALAATCRFTDCAHANEPGCAVRDAVTRDHLQSYNTLRAEMALATHASQADAKKKAKRLGRAVKRLRRT